MHICIASAGDTASRDNDQSKRGARYSSTVALVAGRLQKIVVHVFVHVVCALRSGPRREAKNTDFYLVRIWRGLPGQSWRCRRHAGPSRWDQNWFYARRLAGSSGRQKTRILMGGKDQAMYGSIVAMRDKIITPSSESLRCSRGENGTFSRERRTQQQSVVYI